ncbi:MAG: ABC transporter substrate-binding protein, partial [Psychroserpens sp.]|nr:ABC transporter substrate-binding protein [Psychroserpens sp.]
GPNYTHFKSELFDAWYEEAFTITDRNKREALYTRMDSLILADTPVIPLFYDEVVRFTRKNVSGLGINPINLLDLKRVSKN